MSKKQIATYTCPLGHTHPADQFHMYVDMNVEELEASVTIYCPTGQYGHGFSLRKAVAIKMLTAEQAAEICLQAQELRLKKNVKTRAM